MSTLAGRPTILQLPASTWQRLLTIARRDDPQECCGILVGRRIGGRVHVYHAVEGRNIASGDLRRTYQLDWPTLFATIRACREARNEIVGFYHSHLNGSCEPSKRDLEAAWLEHSYLILGAPYLDVASAASWRISENGDGFVQERLWIAWEAGGATEQARCGTRQGAAFHISRSWKERRALQCRSRGSAGQGTVDTDRA